MPTLEEVLGSAIEIKDLPLRNALESTDCFEICAENGASYHIKLSQLSGEGVTPIQPFSQAISGIDGNIVINHNLNKLPSIVTVDDNSNYVSLVLTQLNLNSVQVQWNGTFSGQIICS